MSNDLSLGEIDIDFSPVKAAVAEINKMVAAAKAAYKAVKDGGKSAGADAAKAAKPPPVPKPPKPPAIKEPKPPKIPKEAKPPAIKEKAKAVEKVAKANKVAAKETTASAAATKGLTSNLGGLAATAAGAAVAGLTAVAGALYKIGEATIGRDTLKNTLDQVTRGRGAEALASLEGIAKGLNLPIADVTQQFVDLRKKGLDNVNAAKLIKLRADLAAVGVDAGRADQAVQAATQSIRMGEGADQAIKRIANAYGAVGDGSNAAAKKAFTLEGQITSIKLALEQGLGKAAEKLGPSILRVVQAINKGLDSIDTKDVEAALDAAGVAVDAVATAVGYAFAFIKMNVDGVRAQFVAWSTAVSATSSYVSSSLQALSTAWTLLKASVSGSIDAATGSVKRFLTDVGETLNAIGDIDLGAAAGRVIDGFIKGIKAGVGKVGAAVKEVGKAAMASLDEALGIASPSKEAAKRAHNVTDTFGDEVEDAEPASLDGMLAPMGGPGSSPLTPRVGGSSGAPVINLTLNVGGSSSTAEEIAIMVEAAIVRAITSGVLQ